MELEFAVKSRRLDEAAQCARDKAIYENLKDIPFLIVCETFKEMISRDDLFPNPKEFRSRATEKLSKKTTRKRRLEILLENMKIDID